MKALHLHKIDRELLDRARVAFRPTPITPGLPVERIMFDAGAAKVLDWLDAELGKKNETVITAPTEEHQLPDSHEGFMRRLAKGTS